MFYSFSLDRVVVYDRFQQVIMAFLYIDDEHKNKFKRLFIQDTAYLRKSILKYGNPQTTLHKMTFSHEIQQELRDLLETKYPKEAMGCLLDAVIENNKLAELYRAFKATSQTYLANMMRNEYERIANTVEDSLSKGKLIYGNFSTFYHPDHSHNKVRKLYY